MSYRELIMIDVKEMLRRRAAKQSARHVARDTGIDRKTVARYFEAAATLPLPVDRAPTDEEVHEVAQRVQARPTNDTTAEWAEVELHRERIAQWLELKRPLRLRKIHTLLRRDHGLAASYDTLRRFAMKEFGWRKKAPTVRLADTAPGQVARVDFGLMGMFADATGKLRRLHVLIVTLAFSRYQFVWPSYEQTTEAVCAGLDAAWRFFGCMPGVLLPDNMSAMVKKSDELAPVLVPAFLDYVQARELLVDTARVRSPKDKARVENQVPYVRESWFDGESFVDLDDARTHAEAWCRDVAGARVHGTTREVPRDVFERQERGVMKPAPTTPFDVPHWSDATVHPDHHVQVLRSLYSVPTRYIGKLVRVRADSSIVRIYLGTELVKVHARVAPGNRVSFKLKKKRVRNPPEMWVREEEAFQPIIEPAAFHTVRGVILARHRRLSDDEMLGRLRAILDAHGRVSGVLIDETDGMPSTAAFRTRFGSLLSAYEKVGYSPERDYRHVDTTRRLRALCPALVDDVVASLERAGARVEREPGVGLLTINGQLRVAIVVARCRAMAGGAPRWTVSLDRDHDPELTIAVRMDDANASPRDYFLFPSLDLRSGRVQLAERNFLGIDAYRYDTLDYFVGMGEQITVEVAA